MAGNMKPFTSPAVMLSLTVLGSIRVVSAEPARHADAREQERQVDCLEEIRTSRLSRSLEPGVPRWLAPYATEATTRVSARSYCLTPLLVDLYRHRQTLAPALRRALEVRATGAALPPSVGSVASARYPIRVHYPSPGYVDRAQAVVDLAEQAWETEVMELGFSAPLPDGDAGGDDSLDIYLASYDLTGGGAYTQPSYWDADPTDGVQACTSYILLYQDLDEAVLPVYVAHEFNHATQCAMDFREFTWAWETTAVFMEDVVFDDINDYYRYIPYFQAYPEQSLVYFDTMPPYGLYAYGATIFIHFLDEALGASDGRVAAQLWRDSEQAGATNEPDFLDAVDALARRHGWDGVEETYAVFASWRYLVSSNDDGHHFEEGADWNATASGLTSIPPNRFEVSTRDLPAQGDLPEVCTLGTSYLLLHPAL